MHAHKQACWQAGIDLNALVTANEDKKQKLRAKGVPEWRTATVSGH